MNEAAGKLKPLPTRIKLLNWGVNESTEGPVIVNEQTVAAFAAMQRKIGRERAPLDFEHNTVPGTPEYERTHEPRIIAAMGTPVVVSGEGVFLESLTYTGDGESAARHFEDVSAAPLLNSARVVVGLHSAALTRTGAVYGAHFAAGDILKLAGDGITLAAFASKLSAAPSVAVATAEPQDTKPMAEQVSIEALSAQIADLAKTLGDRIAALESKPAPTVDLTPLSARLDKIEAAHTAAATAAVEAEKAAIIPLFAAEGRSPVNPATGKAYTADELKALDVPTLKVLHANTPKTVPLNARTRTTSTEGKTELKGLARAIAAHTAGE